MLLGQQGNSCGDRSTQRQGETGLAGGSDFLGKLPTYRQHKEVKPIGLYVSGAGQTADTGSDIEKMGTPQFGRLVLSLPTGFFMAKLSLHAFCTIKQVTQAQLVPVPNLQASDVP